MITVIFVCFGVEVCRQDMASVPLPGEDITLVDGVDYRVTWRKWEVAKMSNEHQRAYCKVSISKV